MSLALLILGLLTAPPAKAQTSGGYPGGGSGGYPGGGSGGGYPGSGWNVTDADGNSIPPLSGGYPLTGTATGAATNTYPQDMTNAALVPPYYDPTYGWVNNSQWLQAASGGPHSYDPNPLGTPYLYNGGTTSAPSASIALNATAHNYAANNSYYGSFNPSAPPFFTNQMYQNPLSCEPVNGTVTGRTTGTLWAYWNWTGSGGAPDHLDLLLTTNVQASKSYENGAEQTSLTATATASDGDPYNETASSDNGVPSVIGRHLLRVPVSGGVAAVSLNGNVSASATNNMAYGALGEYPYPNYYAPTTGPTGALSYGSVSATANQDDREVVLHRDGARGEITDPDGTTHGDTIYSYEEYSNNGVDNSTTENHHINWQTFHAVFTGGWRFLSNYVYPPDDSEGYAPDNFAWTWTPNESQDTYRTGYWAVIDGAYELFEGQWQGSPSGVQQRNIVYTATDSDGATATATYILSVHDPYEWRVNMAINNGAAYEVSPSLIGSSDSTDPAEAGSTISVYYPPVAGSYNVGETWKAGGAVLTTAAAATPFAAEALGPWAIPVTSLLAGSGYVAGTYAPDADKHHTDAPSSKGDFTNDLSDQANINQGNTAGVVYPTQPRFTDTGLAQMIHDTNTADSWYRGLPIGTDASGNPYPAGAWKFTAVAVLHQNRQDYIADTYDAAGKTAPVPGHIMIPTNVEPIRTWTYYPSAAPGGRG